MTTRSGNPFRGLYILRGQSQQTETDERQVCVQLESLEGGAMFFDAGIQRTDGSV